MAAAPVAWPESELSTGSGKKRRESMACKTVSNSSRMDSMELREKECRSSPLEKKEGDSLVRLSVRKEKSVESSLSISERSKKSVGVSLFSPVLRREMTEFSPAAIFHALKLFKIFVIARVKNRSCFFYFAMRYRAARFSVFSGHCR